MRWDCSLFTFWAHGVSPVCLHMLFLLPECPPSCIPISPNNMESRESARPPFVHCLQHFIPKAAFSSVQSLSDVRLFVTPWTAARQASLSITNSQSLLKLMSIELVMPSNHLIPVVPFSSHLQSFPASGSFQWVSPSHQVAKVLEFQLQHQSFQWIFRTDFL